jgi:hypothetical protein
MTEPYETFAPDVTWSCGLCAANGRQMTGTDRESMELHMNEHIAGALEDPVRMVIDMYLPALSLAKPAPMMIDVVQLEDGWALVEVGTTTALMVTPDRKVAEYVARLWNRDHA